MPPTVTKLPAGGCIKLFPSGIVVYNYAADDDGRLSQAISANPGMPVVFLSTKFNRDVFSQAEGRNRTFIFLRGAVDPESVDPTFPAQWLSAGDTLPGLPGNLSVTASDGGFRVRTTAPDPARTGYFGRRSR